MHGDFFKRQIELWGEQTQQSLKDKKVTIVGAGGLGSSLGYALGSSGIGTIEFIDFDRVESHNIHRQIAFDFADEGEYKAKALMKKLAQRAPSFVRFGAITQAFEKALPEGYETDLLIDATDNFAVRKQIDAYAKGAKLPWIYASVEEFNGQICFFEKANFGAFNTADHTPKGIAAPIVMLVAAFEANMVLRYLAGLPIQKDMLHYLYFDASGAFTAKKFAMPKATV